jgi:Mor family transcriptional regulator
MSNTELSAFIDEWVPSKRNRELLKERLIDGIKINVLAEKYELSERQVKNIVKKFKSTLP